MQTKLARLKDAAARGDWAQALRIAAKFPELGEHAAAIKRAHEANHSPEFYRQLGRDPEACVAAGIAALCERYRLSR
jgi:hypothetical protein